MRIRRFLLQHKWSLPLAVSASLAFAHFASEVREGELTAFDRAAAMAIVSWRGSLDGVMSAFTLLGSVTGMATVAIVIVAALLLRGAQRRREAVFLAVAALGGLLLNSGLKLFFHRDRPLFADYYLIPAPASFSFPSGHAMGSMSVAAGLVVVIHVLRWRRPARAVAIVVALLFCLGVAVSRVYFGVHFPSDVIAGQLAAAAWVCAVTGWFYPRLLPGEGSELAATTVPKA